MKKPNQIIQSGKLKIKSVISEYQIKNEVPNFVVEMILSEILNEIKDLRMSEMYIETLEGGNKENGNTNQEG